jgi:hypothetical protein
MATDANSSSIIRDQRRYRPGGSNSRNPPEDRYHFYSRPTRGSSRTGSGPGSVKPPSPYTLTGSLTWSLCEFGLRQMAMLRCSSQEFRNPCDPIPTLSTYAGIADVLTAETVRQREQGTLEGAYAREKRKVRCRNTSGRPAHVPVADPCSARKQVGPQTVGRGSITASRMDRSRQP